MPAHLSTASLNPDFDLGTDPIMRAVERRHARASSIAQEALAGNNFTHTTESLFLEVSTDGTGSPAEEIEKEDIDRIVNGAQPLVSESIFGKDVGDVLDGLRRICSEWMQQWVNGERRPDANPYANSPTSADRLTELSGIWHDMATRLADLSTTWGQRPAGHVALDRDTFGRVCAPSGDERPSEQAGWSFDPDRNLRRMHESALFMTATPPHDSKVRDG